MVKRKVERRAGVPWHAVFMSDVLATFPTEQEARDFVRDFNAKLSFRPTGKRVIPKATAVRSDRFYPRNTY